MWFTRVMSMNTDPVMMCNATKSRDQAWQRSWRTGMGGSFRIIDFREDIAKENFLIYSLNAQLHFGTRVIHSICRVILRTAYSNQDVEALYMRLVNIQSSYIDISQLMNKQFFLAISSLTPG